jgi:hypothetical protein
MSGIICCRPKNTTSATCSHPTDTYCPFKEYYNTTLNIGGVDGNSVTTRHPYARTTVHIKRLIIGTLVFDGINRL